MKLYGIWASKDQDADEPWHYVAASHTEAVRTFLHEHGLDADFAPYQVRLIDAHVTVCSQEITP